MSYTIRHIQTKRYMIQQPNPFNQYTGKVPLFFWTTNEDQAVRFDSEEQANKVADYLWKSKRIQEGIPCFEISKQLIQKIYNTFKDRPESHRIQIHMKSLEQANSKDGTLTSLLEVEDLNDCT